MAIQLTQLIKWLRIKNVNISSPFQSRDSLASTNHFESGIKFKAKGCAGQTSL